MSGHRCDVVVKTLDVSAYTIPTDYPEADGTYAWDATALVLVEASGGGRRGLALSAHCVPSLHVQPCCAIPRLSPIEYFHDHARIEQMLFEGALTPVDGALHPDRAQPGLGLEFKRADAARYAV